MVKPKAKSVYRCQDCGFSSAKWLGRCPECGQWNSLVEEALKSVREEEGLFFTLTSTEATSLPAIESDYAQRLPTQISELDRVLGGGLVPGSMVLLGGDPGIGKSTLILQTLNQMASVGRTVLYATGEESKQQIRIRADRLGISSQIWILAENSLEKIVEQVQKIKPDVLVVDSIQTVYLENLESAPGSVSQVRECAGKLLFLAKSTGLVTIVIGHVTKEGGIAGPKLLEHLVDCVLYFEGDVHQHYRVLRTIKNRYGSTQEIGVFEMNEKGLEVVQNPSSLFLSGKNTSAPGSAITATLEGGRSFLVEIQALVSFSSLTNPRRTTQGVDPNRVAILIAVLEKVVGLNLYNQDVYVNAAGGFRVVEPAADLAILAALVSSVKNKILGKNLVFLGEIALSGEIRSVQGLDLRLLEAKKVGFTHFVLPKHLKNSPSLPGTEVLFVERVADLLDKLF
ncbi:MAG: DNA repair protein RadA [Deltaproteobacteria bacterium RIFCSPLOWO2_12_FULL_40_28]|nr:MAG: DNA repair protein RadA [Deltaproteobacteria bacterium RIFCSPHIGHO2_02_FULL_40_28]OGQ19506.1 MAG: DNA repair protein RadA [Deltaproteobacteria bacterium RIFCSPHIGHO2_12_FULL_40_32]OGQ39980.1 MAG: DNA repair protein RadA [Deltaproteobacteria bacterium RIFCSPLOWO2_02_FULL_40_36]OGQ54347.1 MAG: DNA repair protein RadA [Deltaproteobacteria bacterium RIFCSPLOWO2_12_FULL_40_28]